MAAWAELCALTFREVPEWSGPLTVSYRARTNCRSWLGTATSKPERAAHPVRCNYVPANDRCWATRDEETASMGGFTVLSSTLGAIDGKRPFFACFSLMSSF